MSYREAAGFYDEAAQAVGFDPGAALSYALDAAGALYNQGNEFGDNPALIDAIFRYREALERTSRECVPLDWAFSRHTLALLVERTGGRTRMTEAIGAMRDAAQVYREGGNGYWLPVAERRIGEMEAAFAGMKP